MEKEAKVMFLTLLIFFLIWNMNFVKASSYHAIVGYVYDAKDGTKANGAEVKIYLAKNPQQILSDIVGFGNANKSNYFFVDIASLQWKPGDILIIEVFKDEEHKANASLQLSMFGFDYVEMQLSGGYCGDGICGGNESLPCCDCIECGNGICEFPCENFTTCSEDCSDKCGDGICEKEEIGKCLFDCHCGNFVCEKWLGETAGNCFVDCHCGNGICDDEEDENTCPRDCLAKCGNGICELPYETNQNCCLDCGCEADWYLQRCINNKCMDCCFLFCYSFDIKGKKICWQWMALFLVLILIVLITVLGVKRKR